MDKNSEKPSVTVDCDGIERVIITFGKDEVRLSSYDAQQDASSLRCLIGKIMASEYERGKVDGAAEKPPTAYKSLFYVSNGGVGFGFATRHTVEAMADAAKRVNWTFLPFMSSVVGKIMPPKPEHENADPDALVTEAIMHMLRNQ